jgi:hypothetical protein
MPSIRVIAGAVIGCLFVCGLFGCQGVAQTASTEPVGKPMQLPQPMHPGKSETKPHERSAAKHSSKAHPAAKKRASTKPAAKESALNGASQVTANELMVDDETVRVASPDDANDLDLAANAQGAAASDASPAAATVVTAAGTETIAPRISRILGRLPSQRRQAAVSAPCLGCCGSSPRSAARWHRFDRLVPDRVQRLSCRMGQCKANSVATYGRVHNVHTILGSTELANSCTPRIYFTNG